MTGQPENQDNGTVTCKSCGKPLTAPGSQALRRGPVCFARHVGAVGRRKGGGIDGEVPLFDIHELEGE